MEVPKRFRVVITPPLAENTSVPDLLRNNGCEVIINQGEYPITDSDKLGTFLSCADAVIIGLEGISDELLVKCPNLRVLARVGTGMDNVDVQAATNRNVVVTNTPGANSRSVAELAMSFLVMLSRRSIDQHQMFQKQKWERFAGQEVYGRTLSIVGLGNIGKKVARLAQAYGMTVLANDIGPDKEFGQEYQIPFVSFEEVLSRADFLTLHVPLTDLTRNMIDAHALAMMRPGSFLVNTSRGPVVNVDDTVLALRTGHLSGFATDVPVTETVLDAQLQGMENVITTPHIGGYTTDALDRVFKQAAINVLSVLSGEEPPNALNAI